MWYKSQIDKFVTINKNNTRVWCKNNTFHKTKDVSVFIRLTASEKSREQERQKI